MKINQIKQLIQEAIQAIFEADLQYNEGDRVEIDSSYGGGIGTVVLAKHPFYAIKFDQTGTTDSFHFSDLRPFDDEEEEEKNADIDTGLNENVLLHEGIQTSSNLKYHLNKKLPLTENIFRYGSDAQLQLFKEARELYNKGLLYLNAKDRWLVENTDIGEYGEFEGKLVSLDVPFVEEEQQQEEWPTQIKGNDDIIWIKTKVFSNGVVNYTPYYKGYNIDFGGHNFKTLESLQRYIDAYVLSNVLYSKYKYEPEKPLSLNEIEYQGKEVQLNKPKRGGSKKFYVYVKNPKTGKVKKVAFGAAGGGQNLAVKIRDPKARRAFASRQNCARKKDRTTPGYWSCNIGRYWKSLGGGSNFSGYW
jgi:hypothetical protein